VVKDAGKDRRVRLFYKGVKYCETLGGEEGRGGAGAATLSLDVRMLSAGRGGGRFQIISYGKKEENRRSSKGTVRAVGKPCFRVNSSPNCGAGPESRKEGGGGEKALEEAPE